MAVLWLQAGRTEMMDSVKRVSDFQFITSSTASPPLLQLR